MTLRPPRRASLRSRIELGLAAFAPALALMAYRSRGTGWLWLFAVPAIAGVVIMVLAALIVRTANAESYSFGDIEDLSGDILGHIGAYLLAVLIEDPHASQQMVITTAVMALIIHVHVATGQVYVNPLLYLTGYRIFFATSANSSFYLITRRDPADWTTPQRSVRIASNVLIDRAQRTTP
ncbi:MAG: hypothetical protein H6512_14765 [Acidimicrobiia bacterium]|nr:hypothetical protein [Acidimicrobiia bacterium]